MSGTIPRRSLTIILVEDDALVRMTMAALMEEMGHTVTETSRGDDALAALANGADVLVTDRHLPDTSGDELAELALRRQPGLAVVIATGDAPDAASRHIWLQKPFSGARLRAAIDRAASTA